MGNQNKSYMPNPTWKLQKKMIFWTPETQSGSTNSLGKPLWTPTSGRAVASRASWGPAQNGGDVIALGHRDQEYTIFSWAFRESLLREASWSGTTWEESHQVPKDSARHTLASLQSLLCPQERGRSSREHQQSSGEVPQLHDGHQRWELATHAKNVHTLPHCVATKRSSNMVL